MATKQAIEARKKAALCTQCGAPAHFNAAIGKFHTLCSHHVAMNKVRREIWKNKNPESYAASRKKDLARRKNLRRVGKFRTKRTDNYLQWLFSELRRLRDLDAMGDVKQ